MGCGTLTMATTTIAETCAAAKRAARTLASASDRGEGRGAGGDRAAARGADGRRSSRRTPPISPTSAPPGLTEALRDRLTLTAERVAAMAEGVRVVAALDDPVGEELERQTLDSGLDLRKVRVPLGVVAVIYEARPNVTIDCAALTIKSGNAIVLRGSSYAERSNARAGGDRPRGAGRGGAARGRGAAARRGGDRDGLAELATAGGRRRPADPARRRGPEGGARRRSRRCR